MFKDRQEALEALEAELLREEQEEAQLPEEVPEEPEYRNFSNDYGREPRKEPVKTKPAKTSKKRSERVTLGLMITACCLTAGIIGVLMYWLLFLLK